MLLTLSKEDIPFAKQIVEEEWGSLYAHHFEEEMSGLGNDIFLVGIKVDNDLAGIAVVCKSLMDFSFWELTWVTVAKKYRKSGLGSKLVKKCEEIALLESIRFPSKKVIMQLTTDIPGWYTYKHHYNGVVFFGDGYQLMVKHLRNPV